jgi:hypothetical protein
MCTLYYHEATSTPIGFISEFSLMLQDNDCIQDRSGIPLTYLLMAQEFLDLYPILLPCMHQQPILYSKAPRSTRCTRKLDDTEEVSIPPSRTFGGLTRRARFLRHVSIPPDVSRFPDLSIDPPPPVGNKNS